MFMSIAVAGQPLPGGDLVSWPTGSAGHSSNCSQCGAGHTGSGREIEPPGAHLGVSEDGGRQVPEKGESLRAGKIL